MGWKGALAALALVAAAAYGDESTYRQIAAGCSSGYEDFFLQAGGKLESIKTGVEKIGMNVKVRTDSSKVDRAMQQYSHILLGHCHPTQDNTLEARVADNISHLPLRNEAEKLFWYRRLKAIQENNFLFCYATPSIDDVVGFLMSSDHYAGYNKDATIDFPVVTKWNDELRVAQVYLTPTLAAKVKSGLSTSEIQTESQNYNDLKIAFIQQAWSGKDPLFLKDPDVILAAFEKLLEEKSNVRLKFEKY